MTGIQTCLGSGLISSAQHYKASELRGKLTTDFKHRLRTVKFSPLPSVQPQLSKIEFTFIIWKNRAI